MSAVKLDLNAPKFQEDLLELGQEDALALLATLRKIRKLSWNELYRDRGLRWETIHSHEGPKGERVYSLRVTRRMRALALRDGDFLVLLSVHPDHDSAYQ